MDGFARTYISIDLKSFYASVECVKRGLDPLATNLVVADKSRTEKTICLAVTPSLKAYGISGRARLFEVVQRVDEINRSRLANAPGHRFSASSSNDPQVRSHPELKLDYIVAPPQMSSYMKISAEIYRIYLKYVAPEDIHVYSVDEVFMDVTDYLRLYSLTPREFAMKMIQDVFSQTGITATAGIGTNLYLCKVAMDIVAKHIPADENGVRIAQLDEMSYRRKLWDHTPLTDFWRVGPGYARKLKNTGLYTMGDVAQYSLSESGREHLYRLFGVNAELLIDHAWGYEPCTISDIKGYGAQTKSLGSGQVLAEPYPYEKARIVTIEMADALALDLTAKHLVTDQIVLTINYDLENLKETEHLASYEGNVKKDRYGRSVPEHAHGTENLETACASEILITDAAKKLFDRIVDKRFSVRRITITAGRVCRECEEPEKNTEKFEQLSFFEDGHFRGNFCDDRSGKENKTEMLEKEKRRQQALLDIRKRYGKNAVVKGTDLMDGATARERNGQIGGHKA